MANALSPTAPPPDMAPAPQTNQGNALAGPMQGAPAPQQPGGAQQQPPAPSNAQTVAALRHFHMIESALEKLLKDPEVGKSDVKSDVIDSVAKLVSEGFMNAPEAVQELGTFPERPFDQKKWLEQHYLNTIMAADVVLTHHGMAFKDQNLPDAAPSMDNHAGVIGGLMRQYGGQNA